MTIIEKFKVEFFGYADRSPMSIDNEKLTISLEDFEYLIKKLERSISESKQSKRLDELLDAYAMGRQNKTIKEFNKKFRILI